MRTLGSWVAAACAVILHSSLAMAADANAGKRFFQTQCALCHSAESGDHGGAQGPNLLGVYTRHAASAQGFSYTQALRNSNLTWDQATLDRFLASPTTVVPGSAMVIAVPKPEDRQNVIAYFQALNDGSFKDVVRGGPGGGGPPPGFAPPPPAAPPVGTPDWVQDAPGRAHRVNLAQLPAPFDTPSARNFPQLVDRPPAAQVKLPPGFQMTVFASDLKGPRVIRIAPNGDVFVSETLGSQISVLRPSADGSKAASVTTFAQGLVQPHGMAFFPAGDHPQWLYVAENNRVVRYPYKVGDQTATGVPEVIVPQLAPVGGGHYTRDIIFSKDGKRMFIAVGSGSNVAEAMPTKTVAEAQAWETQHGLGAAWGPEENRADVLVFDAGGPAGAGRVFASGIRNCVGLTIEPKTGDLWCTTNERDELGDNLVPDYSTRVKEGAFYGWPWYYMGNHEDPRLKGQRPDLAGKVTNPDVPYQAHSASLGLTFYTARSGSSAFPKEYLGDGFAVLHGSWNRAFRTGHKIVRVRMKNGVPTGQYDDFLVGFITPDGNAWARPAAITVASDGSLLMSDDGHNLIYRISYSGGHQAHASKSHLE